VFRGFFQGEMEKCRTFVGRSDEASSVRRGDGCTCFDFLAREETFVIRARAHGRAATRVRRPPFTKRGKMRKALYGLSVLVALGLAACATPYQANAFRGGFEDNQLQPDVFTVSFNGNAYTDMGTVRNYALYRCAELTVERGYDHFIILRDKENTNRSATATAHTATEEQKHQTFFTIKVAKGPKPTDNDDAYDAKFLLQSLHVDK
jgi:hypothetical protein